MSTGGGSRGRRGAGGRGGGRGGAAHADPAGGWEKKPGTAPPQTAEEKAAAALSALGDAPALPGTTAAPKPGAVAAAKTADKKPAAKKAEPKKTEPKKTEPKKAEPKKAEPKKAEPKKAAAAPNTDVPADADMGKPAATTESTASSGRGRRGRAAQAGAGDISNRTRQARKDRPAKAAAAPSAAAPDDDGAAAAEAAAALENIEIKMPEGAGEHRFRMPKVSHARVKIQTCTIAIGGKNFMLRERSVPGQDDAVYEKHRDVWEAVPRGHCVVSVETGKNEFTPVGEMLGMHKFGYRDSKYGRRDDIKTAVAIEKENGECAHLGAFAHDGVRYWLAGSKHVTIFFRDGPKAEEDIVAFQAKQRTKMASKVARMAVTTLAKLTEAQRLEFHDALAGPGWTANAEVIFADSQHIVDYNGCDDLRFYAITGPGPTETFGLCAIGPDQSQALFEKCGLHAIKRNPRLVYDSPEYKERIKEIARRENSEGSVMYGEDENGIVVCMWKEKSYPYVMERIVREAIKGQKIGNVLADYIQYRLGKMEKSLRQYFVAWEKERLPFLMEFAAWLHEINAFKGKDAWDISCQWLTLQRKCKDVDPAKRAALVKKYAGEKQITSDIAPILLAGPPGSGKSTLARALHVLLKAAGQSPRWLNQDEAGADRKKFIAAIERASRDTSVTHVILDKSNLAAANRKDYSDLKLTPAVTLVFNHPEGPEPLADLCIKRVVGRGPSHRTLVIDQKNEAKMTKVIQDFVAKADWPDDPSCAELDVRKPLPELLADAWAAVVANNPKPLPAITELKADEALQTAMQYEGLLKRFGGQQQLFASIKALNSDDIRAMIPAGVLPKKLVVKPGELHVTVKYFGGEIDPGIYVEHAKRIGTQIKLTLNELVYDEKGACVTVSGNFTSSNANPHMTIGNAPGVPPVYSNELLAKPASVVKRVALNKDVQAVFAFQ